MEDSSDEAVENKENKSAEVMTEKQSNIAGNKDESSSQVRTAVMKLKLWKSK